MLGSLKDLRRRTRAAVTELFGEEAAGGDGGDEIGSVVLSFERVKSRFIEDTAARGRVTRQLELQNRESKLFYELGDRLQACQTLEEADAAVSLFGRQLFPGHAGALYVYRNSRNQLEKSAAWGEAATPLRANFEPSGCWALRRGKVHFLAGESDDLRCEHVGRQARDSLCVPIMAQGEAFGLLHLQRAAAPEAGEAGGNAQASAENTASQIGLALANLKLRETLRQQAIRDALTGLYNRRFMDESLEREVARALRNKTTLAVIMLDIDHFKRFNDEFGHKAGDAVLQALGGLVQRHIRGSDVACRFGGEEFLIVMPEIASETARARAEALRLAIHELKLAHEGRALGSVTISLGLSLLPQHGATSAALIAAADAAMYEAKRSGRDRLVVSDGHAPLVPVGA